MQDFFKKEEFTQTILRDKDSKFIGFAGKTVRDYGMHFIKTSHYNSQGNVILDCANRTLLESLRIDCLDAGIPEDYWMQILDSVVRQLNVDVECKTSEDQPGVLKVVSLVLMYRPRKDKKLISC